MSPQLVLLGAHLAEHHRIDDLEMRRVGGQREMDVVAVELAVGRGTEVVLHVARALRRRRAKEPPLNSWNSARCGLPSTWVEHVEAAAMGHAEARCRRTPSAPPRLMICSSAGTSASAPSRPKRLVPVYFRSRNFSKPSASTSLLRIARLALAGEGDLLVRPLDALLEPGLLLGVGDVHELDADRAAIGPLQDRDHLADGGELHARARCR